MTEEIKGNLEEKKGFKMPKKKIWMITSIALVIILVAVFIFFGTGATSMTIAGSEDVVEPEDAALKALEFINANLVQPGTEASFVSVNDFEGIYNVTLSYQEREISVFMTKDGSYMFLSTPLDITKELPTPEQSEQPEQPEELPKTDKPVIDLFIWSYCPYGVSAQAPMADVAKLFGDKAEFNAIMYHDGHGAYETQQNKIQACIQEVDKVNYWNYAKKFVEEIYPSCASSRDVDCDKSKSVQVMNSLGIDSDAVMSCVENRGDTLIAGDRQYAASLGVTGSPTIVINGVKVTPSGRTAEAFKSSVCEGFDNPPEECSQVLSGSSNPTSGSC